MTHLFQPHTQCMLHDAVHSAKARFFEQKNGNHSEKVLFTTNIHKPSMCSVHAMLWIRSRAQCFGRHPSRPIGASKRAGIVVLLHDSMIRKHIQSATKAVCRIMSSVDITRYSSHLSRVGVAVRLHLEGKDSLFIYTRIW